MLDFASKAASSSAEVPIPVLAESSDAEPSNATTSVNGASTSNTTPVPIISVTKPPAPRPVDLPSPGDFHSPSPTDSRATSFDADLEQGRKLSLDEVEHPLSGASVVVKPPSPTTPTPSTVKEATLVQIPTEEEVTPQEPAKDLLQGEAEESNVPITPMEPVATPVKENSPTEELLVIADNSTVDPSTENTSPQSLANEKMSTTTSGDTMVESLPKEDSDGKQISEPVNLEKLAAEDDDEDPDTTIRLVGGGGTAGIVSAEPEVDQSDTASLASESSVRTTGTDAETGDDGAARKKKLKHDKKKSFSAGLKRISKLGGGKKRTDSKESVGSASAAIAGAAAP
jgi:hypothetical protein